MSKKYTVLVHIHIQCTYFTYLQKNTAVMCYLYISICTLHKDVFKHLHKLYGFYIFVLVVLCYIMAASLLMHIETLNKNKKENRSLSYIK